MRFLNFSRAFCQLEIALECEKKSLKMQRENARPDDEWNYNQQTVRKQKLKVNIARGGEGSGAWVRGSGGCIAGSGS